MIRPQMTAQQAEALAAYVVTLRPGQRAWTKAAVGAALAAAANARTNDTELLSRAAIAAALSPSVKTPEVIPMTGAHWDGVGDYTHEPPRNPARCPKCRDWHTPTAPCAPRPSQRHGDHIAAMRTALAGTRLALCAHGVRPEVCNDHREPATG